MVDANILFYVLYCYINFNKIKFLLSMANYLLKILSFLSTNE